MHELIPIGDGFQMLVSGSGCLSIHIVMNRSHKLFHSVSETFPRGLEFLSRRSDHALDLTLGHILSTQLDANGCAANFPFVKFIAGVVSVGIVNGDTKAYTTELGCNLMGFRIEFISTICGFADWDNHELDLGNLRRQDKTLVV